MKSFVRNEKGESVLLIVFGVSVFIGCLALVLDIGSLYLEKNKLQKIVDAAALAGAQELPNHYSKAVAEIKKTIQYNEGDPNHFTIDTNEDYTMVEVSGSKIGTLYFAKALGILEPTIQATAKVELLPLVAGIGAIPLGVQPTTELSYGTLQDLKVSDSASGNFGAIALTGPGAKDYETDLTNGYGFELTIGQILNTETGKMSGPTQRAVNHRVSQCPNATYTNYSADCARIVLVPIYEPVQTDQKQIKQVRVVGFATFFLEGVSSTNEGAVVTGRFITFATSGESSLSQANFGTYGYRLTE